MTGDVDDRLPAQIWIPALALAVILAAIGIRLAQIEGASVLATGNTLLGILIVCWLVVRA